MWITRIALALALAAAAAAAVARAAPADGERPRARLSAVERELDVLRRRGEALDHTAESVAEERERLRGQLVAVARRAQDREATVTRLEDSISRLTAEEEAESERLAERRARLVSASAALVALARRPPLAIAAAPGGRDEAVRRVLLLRAAVPALGRVVEESRRRLDALDALRANIVASRAALVRETAALEAERTRLASLTEAKSRLEAAARSGSQEARARAASLAGEARTLRDLIASLDAARKAREAERAAAEAENRDREQAAETPPAPQPKPSLAELAAPAPEPRPSAGLVGRMPARGRIVRLFGQDTATGSDTKGISIETRPSAQVTAPVGGTVVFAGPFRRYGQLLILEHGDGYHILLAGMTRIDAKLGDRVVAGEPVGVMAASAGSIPTLYVELRREGRPINPLPWLSALNTRING